MIFWIVTFRVDFVSSTSSGVMALRDVATASESYLRSHPLPKYLPADFDLVDLFVSFFLLVFDLDILNQVVLLILLAFLTYLYFR